MYFMASDDLPNMQVSPGSNFALFLSFSDEKEQAAIFSKLSDSGAVSFPLENGSGMLSDKFGVQWMLAYKE